jgi:hypothetical protein
MNKDEILDKAVSHVMELGLFDQVNFHSSLTAPGKDLSADITVASYSPMLASGANSVSARLELQFVLVYHLINSPADQIDKIMLNAADLVMQSFANDFDLGETLRMVDIFGAHGTSMNADFGYVDYEDSKYRVAVITVPLIINDVWEEVA